MIQPLYVYVRRQLRKLSNIIQEDSYRKQCAIDEETCILDIVCSIYEGNVGWQSVRGEWWVEASVRKRKCEWSRDMLLILLKLDTAGQEEYSAMRDQVHPSFALCLPPL